MFQRAGSVRGDLHAESLGFEEAFQRSLNGSAVFHD
jgi:hypothetical protein